MSILVGHERDMAIADLLDRHQSRTSSINTDDVGLRREPIAHECHIVDINGRCSHGLDG